MKSRYEMVDNPSLELVLSLASVMRQEDADEVWASAHVTPAEALKISHRVSANTIRVGLVDDKIAIVFGVRENCALSRSGVPWLLTSNLAAQHSLHFLRVSVGVVNEWRQQYKFLENYVDARYTDAVEWLDWLGFDLDDPKPYGAEQLPFHRFHWSAQDG